MKQNGFLFIYVFLIFTILPAGPQLVSRIDKILPIAYVFYFVMACLSLVLIFRISVSKRKKRFRLRVAFGALFYVLALVFALTQIKLVVERVHILEYGLLFILLFQAFRRETATRKAYQTAFLFSCGVGLLDETVQCFLPGRYFGWRDILFNVLGALSGMCTCALYRFSRKFE